MSNFRVRQLTARAENIPSYSVAYPLEPRGNGSGQIECLTGYVMRLADFHWMATGSFLNQVLKPLMPRTYGVAEMRHSHHFGLANGYGNYAKRLSEAVTSATAGIDARFLTSLAWSQVFDPKGHGLLKSHLEWCTACWQSDAAVGETPYTRLVWTFQPVQICPHHVRPLHSFCPHCGAPQKVVSVLPRAWICQSCARSLIDARCGHPLQKAETQKQYWVATAVERLVQRTCSAGLMVPDNRLRLAIRDLALTHADGSYMKLGRYTNIEASYLWSWATGKSHPTLPATLDLCYRIDVPPDAFLFDGLALTNPSIWRRTGKPHFVSLVKLSSVELNRIQQKLRKLITKNPEPPPLISEVANSLKITFSVLRYHFPDEYRILQQRSHKWRHYLRTEEGRIRMDRFVASVEKLLEKGIYPSERQLKQLGYVRPGELRRPELIQKLRELQKQYTDLPIAIQNRRLKSGRLGVQICSRNR